MQYFFIIYIFVNVSASAGFLHHLPQGAQPGRPRIDRTTRHEGRGTLQPQLPRLLLIAPDQRHPTPGLPVKKRSGSFCINARGSGGAGNIGLRQPPSWQAHQRVMHGLIFAH